MGSAERKLRVSDFRTTLRTVRFGEHGDVGSAESVDGLLRVAHEEQPSRFVQQVGPRTGVLRRGGNQLGQVDLDGIGVLELVDQQLRIALGQHFSGLGAVFGVPQQVSGQHQQVVELQHTLSAPISGGFKDECSQHPGQPFDHDAGHLELRLLHRRAQSRHPGADIANRQIVWASRLCGRCCPP